MGEERGSNGGQSLQRANTKGKRSSVAGFAGYETPLAWLQGTWRGKGKGIFPTIKDFEYNEEICIHGDVSNPRPVLTLKQRTWNMQVIPKPMHEETGFIRVLASHPSGPRVEWVMSAPNGVTTIEEGELDVEHHTIRLRSVCIGRSSTARPPHVVDFHRTYEVDMSCDPPRLHYTMDMSTTTTPVITRHLEAWLVRATPGQQVTTATPMPTSLPTGAAPTTTNGYTSGKAGPSNGGYAVNAEYTTNGNVHVAHAAIENGHLANIRSISSNGAPPPPAQSDGPQVHSQGWPASALSGRLSRPPSVTMRTPIVESYVLGPNGIVRSAGSVDASSPFADTGHLPLGRHRSTLAAGSSSPLGNGGGGGSGSSSPGSLAVPTSGAIPIGCPVNHGSFTKGVHGMSALAPPLLGSHTSMHSGLASSTSSPMATCPVMHY